MLTAILPAHSSKEVTLSDLDGDPALQNSFLVIADGSPGDIAAKLVARSDSELREVELLGKDLMDEQNSGNHPWTVANNTDSTLLLFNTSETAQNFLVMISGKGKVWQKAYQLKALETRAIDIRKLILNRSKDDYGNPLPRDIESGQVGWFLSGLNKGRGRLIESNLSTAMARSFSCGTYSSVCGSTFSPATTNYTVGQTAYFGDLYANVCLASTSEACSGSLVGTSTSYIYSWGSLEPGILAISGPSSGVGVDLKAISAGSANIEGIVSDGSCLSEDVIGASAIAPTATVLGRVHTSVELR